MAFNTLYEFEGIEDYYIHEIKLSTLSMSSRNISHLVTSTGSSFNTLYEFPDNHACSRRYNGDSLSTLSMSSRYGRYRCIRFDILSTLSMSSWNSWLQRCSISIYAFNTLYEFLYRLYQTVSKLDEILSTLSMSSGKFCYYVKVTAITFQHSLWVPIHTPLGAYYLKLIAFNTLYEFSKIRYASFISQPSYLSTLSMSSHYWERKRWRNT